MISYAILLGLKIESFPILAFVVIILQILNTTSSESSGRESEILMKNERYIKLW